MANTLSPVPRTVAEVVSRYIEKARSDREKYDNVKPLDTGDVWNLHALAREVYAAGWQDGMAVAQEMQRVDRG